MDVDGTYGSLVPPFNPAKVEELLATALAAAGFAPPQCVPYSVEPSNTLLNVSVEDGYYTPEQIAQLVALLDAVAADPTRNALTDEQQEEVDLQNKLDKVGTAVDAMVGISNGPTRIPPVDNTDGYADQMTGTELIVGTSLKAQLLTNTAWNALTAEAKANLIRTILLDLLPILAKWVRSCADVARAVRYLLREEKKRHTGVFMASKLNE